VSIFIAWRGATVLNILDNSDGMGSQVLSSICIAGKENELEWLSLNLMLRS